VTVNYSTMGAQLDFSSTITATAAE